MFGWSEECLGTGMGRAVGSGTNPCGRSACLRQSPCKLGLLKQHSKSQKNASGQVGPRMPLSHEAGLPWGRRGNAIWGVGVSPSMRPVPSLSGSWKSLPEWEMDKL